MKLLWLLLLSLSALANDNVGFGISSVYPYRYSLNIGDMRYFQQKTAEWGLVRYGYSYAKLSIGNGLGLDFRASGGAAIFSLLDQGEGLAPFVGVDFATLYARADTNAPSFYAWMPTLSVGPQYGSASTRILPAFKVGPYIGNINANRLSPDLRLVYGGSLYVSHKRYSLNTDFFFTNTMSIQALNVYYRFSDDFRIGFHIDNVGQTQSFGLLFKSDLF